MTERPARTGDRVRVVGGPYDGRAGFVQMVKTPDDILFEHGSRPLHGLLGEDFALIRFNDPKGDGNDEIGIPVRRLQIL